MMKNHSVYFVKLDGLKPSIMLQIRSSLLKQQYDQQLGFGFRNVTGTTDYLTATLIKRIPTFIPQLEIDTGEIIQKEFFIYSEIEFGIDSKNGLLEIYGSLRNYPKLSSHLNSLLDKEINVSPIVFTPFIITNRLLQNASRFSIERMIVNNFSYKTDISGRFDMRVGKSATGLEIINQYANDVTKIVFQINVPEVGQVKVSISNTGSLIIKCSSSDFSESLDYLKTNLFPVKE